MKNVLMSSSVASNLDKIREELSPFDARLVAVSKTKPIEAIEEAYDAGQRIFGENKVQELRNKAELLNIDVEWHMIGHLQRNKVKYIAPFVTLIHAVDSIKLLQEIEKQAAKNDRIIHCLLQVHIAEESTKFGFDIDEVQKLVDDDAFKDFTYIRVAGLMGMATNTPVEDQIRSEFRDLRSLYDNLQDTNAANVIMNELSMGMSGDYKIALEEGSTLVRIGSAIFGARNY